MSVLWVDNKWIRLDLEPHFKDLIQIIYTLNLVLLLAIISAIVW